MRFWPDIICAIFQFCYNTSESPGTLRVMAYRLSEFCIFYSFFLLT